MALSEALRKMKRWRYRKALWSACQDACGNTSGMYANKVNPINGLRVIRAFERVNGFPFDPFNSTHRSLTYNNRALCVLRTLRLGFGSICRDMRAGAQR